MNGERAIRFGVQLTAAADAHEWRSTARRAEDSGYAIITLPDHLGDQLAPLPALAAAAEATRTIRLGTLVLANDLRHPAMLAKEVASLDLLSGGRVELGLGAGWDAAEFGQLGVPLDPAPLRIERLGEAVVLVRQLLSGDHTTFEGVHYRTQALSVLPKSPQPGGPPIAIGGGGPKVLALAGRLADIVSVTPYNGSVPSAAFFGMGITRAALGRQIDGVALAAGERFRDLELNVRVRAVAVGPGRSAAASSLSAGRGCRPQDLIDSPFALLGTESEIVDHVLEVREAFGVSYFTVSQPHLEALTPVVARLSST